jgi:hypothetical protein
MTIRKPLSVVRVLVGVVAVVAALSALWVVSESAFYFVVGGLLIVLPVFGWYAASELRGAAREAPRVASLQSRATDQVVLASSTTIGGLLGLVVFLRAVELIEVVPREVVLVGIAAALLLQNVPGVDWLRTFRPYRRGSPVERLVERAEERIRGLRSDADSE